MELMLCYDVDLEEEEEKRIHATMMDVSTLIMFISLKE